MTPTQEAELLDIQRTLIKSPLETDELTLVEKAIQAQHLSLQFVKDPRKPWAGPNRLSSRALLIAGAFRAGKTYLAEYVISRLPSFETQEGRIESRPVHVKASSTFNIEQLGRNILDCTGNLPARSLGPTRTMERVGIRLGLKTPTMIHIDEAQRLARPERVAPHRLLVEQERIFGYLRDILDLAAWPVPIVLTGTADLLPVLEQKDLGFFREKMDTIYLEPMVLGRAKDREDLASAVTGYPGKVGMTVDLAGTTQFYDRLIVATNYAKGLAFEVCRDAILIAASEGRKILTVEDFATYYTRKTGCVRQANPFIASDWHRIDPTVLLAAVTGDKPLRIGEIRK
ncbi:MAG: ATP-binding protein [Alphaproteobacteria bacterium]|nr:MAG: ATP-binding protein [Alphaproteobacteria bacterium]